MKRLLLAMSLCVAVLSANAESYPYAPDSVGYIVRIGQKAPDFTVKKTDGSLFTLSECKGRVVLLQFTASWCGVCRKEMKEALEPKIWQKYKDNPSFVFIGIDRDEPLEKVKQFIQQTGITYPMALDPGAETYVKYAERESGITRNVLIDRAGRIVKLTRLYNEQEFSGLLETLEAELEE